MKKVLGIDVGGTKICYAVFDENGCEISKINKIQTPKTTPEIIAVFKQVIQEHESDIDAVAFATAGAINLENTRVASSTPNLPEGYPDIEFEKLTKKPVYVENDANAAAYAEYKIGAAKGDENTITITLGTGIGGGIIINGNLLRGKSGRGGEVGSIKIYPDKRRECTCHNYDCWESYASGTGLKKTAEEIAQSDPVFKSSMFNSKKPNQITTYDITKGVKENDLYSKKVFDLWQSHLVAGLISLTNIFDTESIVISGGMGEFIDVQKIENEINNTIVVSPIKVKLAKMKNNAGMVGAALLAVKKLYVE
ncbi:MAG: ROK family protein [Candidatus Gastranaerophilales bacterium]|nr:ROK family protein [Candidatus Gastranaerophilales bacterium]